MSLVDLATLSGAVGRCLPDGMALGPGRYLSANGGQRAVVRFPTSRDGQPGADLIAKVYADHPRAARLHALLSVLAGVPRPVAHLPRLGVCVYEAAPGRPLDQLTNGARPAALAAAARWLAGLHRARIDFDRALDVAAELENLRIWADLVAAELPGCGAAVDELRYRLDAAGRSVDTDTSVPMHKDFHYQHTLFDDGRVAVIDLDEMRAGEPAVNVAHFAANLRLLEHREGVTGAEVVFVADYRSHGGWWDEERHRFWLAYTFLKLAKQLVRERGPSPAPTGEGRAAEVAFVLNEGLRCLAR